MACGMAAALGFVLGTPRSWRCRSWSSSFWGDDVVVRLFPPTSRVHGSRVRTRPLSLGVRRGRRARFYAFNRGGHDADEPYFNAHIQRILSVRCARGDASACIDPADLTWNGYRSTPRSKTSDGAAEGAVRRAGVYGDVAHDRRALVPFAMLGVRRTLCALVFGLIGCSRAAAVSAHDRQLPCGTEVSPSKWRLHPRGYLLGSALLAVPPRGVFC